MPRVKYGKVFRTRAGKVGRYVYKRGRRVGFKTVKFGYKAAKSGTRRYLQDRTYRELKRRYN